jgi:hypothetical protein
MSQATNKDDLTILSNIWMINIQTTSLIPTIQLIITYISYFQIENATPIWTYNIQHISNN